MDVHPKKEVWLPVKLLVYASAVGARHVVPLQLRQRRTLATMEFTIDLERNHEKFVLKEPSVKRAHDEPK